MKVSVKRNIAVVTLIIVSITSFVYTNLDGFIASDITSGGTTQRTSTLIHETAQLAPTWFVETLVSLFNRHA